MKIEGVTVFLVDGAVVWEDGLSIDVDGAPRAYHPDGKSGLDALGNAGHPGKWWGVETDTGEPDGTPFVQRATDLAPGFLVSGTSLKDKTLTSDGKPLYSRRDPRRYVDATIVPYIAVPPELRSEFKVSFGDVAMTAYWPAARLAGAIVADGGPKRKIGEGSPALADRLGVPSSPRHGGASKYVATVVFPGSKREPRWPRTVADVEEQAVALFTAWGGVERLRKVLTQKVTP